MHTATENQTEAIQPETLVEAALSPVERPCYLGQKWVVWGIAVLFVFYQFFLQLSSGEIITGLMHSYSLTALGGGVLASAYYYVYATLQTPAGMLMDRYGPRRLLTVGAAIVAVGCWLFSTTDYVSLAFVGRLLMGAGASFAFVGSLFLVGRWFPPAAFSMMAATAETVGMVGSLIGGYYLAELVQRVGWRECMFGAAVIGAVICVLLGLIVRDAPAHSRSTFKPVGEHFKRDLKALLRNKFAWINGVYSGLIFSIVSVFVALWGVPFLELSHHLRLSMAALVCNMVFIGVAVGSPLLGWLDARFDIRRPLLFWTAIVAAFCLSLVVYVPSLPMVDLFILMFILGIACSSYVITLVVANEIATPSTRATSLGFVNMFSVGTAPLLQPLVGLLLYVQNLGAMSSEQTHYSVHQYDLALLIMPMLTLVAAWMAFYMPKRP